MTTNFSLQVHHGLAAQEDRSAPVMKLSIPAALRPSGSRSFQTHVHDLSLSGFTATAINRLNVGTLCWLSIPGLQSQEAEVVWWDNGTVGCAFHQLLSEIVVDNILAQWREDGAA